MSLKKTADGELIYRPITPEECGGVHLNHIKDLRRLRSGSDQIFSVYETVNGQRRERIILKQQPPHRSWYALEINGVWQWVEGCTICNGGEGINYVSCEAHDKCQECGCDRKTLTDTPWGTRKNGVWGWTCKPCMDLRKARTKAEAEERIPPDDEYDEIDFWHEDEAKCPWCSAKIYTDCEDQGADGEGRDCPECERPFTLTAEHSVSWTTKRG